MRFFITILFVLIFVKTSAQKITGTVVAQDTGKPIKGVSVFFDNTTVATETDDNGVFTINIPFNNKNQLIVVAEGYDYFLVANPVEASLKIQLKKEEHFMEELVIDKNVFSRKEYLKAFYHFFIGTTDNAKKTKIINENDLVFHYDTKSNLFTAYSEKPIEIENKSLGYRIKFHMQLFEVHFNYKTLNPGNYVSSNYFGYSLFNEIGKPTSRTMAKREATFKRSTPAFFADLADSNLDQSDYILAVNGLKVNPQDYFTINKETTVATICLKQKPTRKTPVVSKKSFSNGSFNPNLATEYKEVEVPFTILNMKTQEQSIFYFQQNCTQISANGQLLKPNDVLFGGFFGDLKTADMLPFDFSNEKIKLDRVQELEKANKIPAYEEFEQNAVDFYTSKDYVAHIKARKLFFDKLKVTYNDKTHEPFPKWIDKNIQYTLFSSKEEAVALHDNFVSSYKLIKEQTIRIEKIEDYYRELYGEKKFDEMYSKALLGGIMSKAELPKPE